MVKDFQTLEELKKEYAVLEDKYSLPSFEVLNKDFNIEKSVEIETDFLIREIRKFIGDKLLSYLRFVENLLNPVNVPMFILSIVKLLDADDKKNLSEIYKELMKNEIMFIELDLEFDEKKEADFIKNSYEFWQKIKKVFLEVIDKINKRWDDKSEVNNKGYFG